MLGLYAFTGLWTRCNAKWILVGAVACISKSIKGIFKNSYVAQLGGAEQDLNAPIHPYSEETKFSVLWWYHRFHNVQAHSKWNFVKMVKE